MALFNAMGNKLMFATVLLLIGMSLLNLEITGAQSIGVCYGRNGNDLPSQQEVINLYITNGITRMRIYDPDSATLQALRGTNIELILGVPNSDLESLATDTSAANQWVERNVRDYVQDVRFRYIAVGNEVDPDTGTAQYVQFVLPAMENVYNAIAAAGLQEQILVSTATYSGLLGNSFPPSEGSFRDNVGSFIEPIIRFLVDNGSPLLVNVYPYFAYIGNPQAISLPYALFTTPDVVVTDNSLEYRNLFDAMLDAYYSALERTNGPNLNIVVSESGWPSEGDNAATIDNARTYYMNLINHVNAGTPKRPGRIEAYLFAMFDENMKDGVETERHFGLFSPNQQSKYQLTFT